tara:strand:+ start:4202 stop:4579 length:378 start_codon:yes stop_codon:yes gene_type:complete
MNTDDSIEVQKSLVTRIKAATGLEVYDNVPTGASFPYVTFGNITALTNASKDIRFFEYSVTLHIWDRSNGTVRTRTTMSDITNNVDNTILVLPANNPAVYFQSATVLKDPDNITNHGVLRFTIKE